MMSSIKKKSYLIVALLCILLLGYFCTYIKYQKLVDIDSGKKRKVVNNVPKEIVSIDKVLKFISDNKLDNLDILNITFKNTSDISNQDLLKLSYYYHKDTLDSIKSLNNKEYLTNVFGSKIKVNDENIYNDSQIFLEYDGVNDIYYLKSSDSIKVVSSIYNHIISFNNVDDDYILVVNKFYEDNNYVYGSYDGMLNKKYLFTIPNNVDKTEYVRDYVEDNYGEISSQIETYLYDFVKEKTSLQLKSYQIVK